jgi:hypothetical protein
MDGLGCRRHWQLQYKAEGTKYPQESLTCSHLSITSSYY